VRLHLCVLAAGFAKRLYPLTQTCSKPLLEVGGEPLLTRIVRQFAATGEVHAVSVVHNRKFAGDYVRWRAAQPAAPPIALVDDGAADDAHALGAVRDLRLLLATAARDPGDGYVVAGGDNVFDFDLRPLLAEFARVQRPMLVLRDVGAPVPGRYSEAVVDAAGRVTSLREKPPDPRSPLSAICLYFVPRDLPARIDEYLAAGGDGDAPGHFFAWLVQRTDVRGVRFQGRWFDIGSADTLAAARRAFGG
jgi:glucose-1-phosphate thymidylyltransferase